MKSRMLSKVVEDAWWPSVLWNPGSDSTGCRAPLKEQEKSPLSVVQPRARGHAWQDPGGRIPLGWSHRMG